MTHPAGDRPEDRHGDDHVVAVRSEERLDVSTRTVVGGHVRIVKRIVTEERQVTVLVRREELVVEQVDVDQAPMPHGRPPGAGPSEGRRLASTTPALELVLSEEEVEVVTRVVPRERVRVYLDEVTEIVSVQESLDREMIDAQGPDAPAVPRSTR